MSSPLKQVNRRQRVWALEDGTTSQCPVPLYLDPRGDVSFCFKLPPYISAALGVPEIVSGGTADAAEGKYNEIVRKYVDHVRTARAEPVLLLHVEGRAEDEEGSSVTVGESDFHFRGSLEGTKIGLAIGYELAFRVNGHIHSREEKWRSAHPRDNEKVIKVGSRMAYPRGIVLDYSPELHARIDQIIATVNKAGLALAEMLKAKDVASALLKSTTLSLPGPDKKIPTRTKSS